MQGHHWNYIPGRPQTVSARAAEALIFVISVAAWIFAGYVYSLGV